MSCTSFQKVVPSLRHNKSYERTDEIKVFATGPKGGGALCTLISATRSIFSARSNRADIFDFFPGPKLLGGDVAGNHSLAGGGR